MGNDFIKRNNIYPKTRHDKTYQILIHELYDYHCKVEDLYNSSAQTQEDHLHAVKKLESLMKNRQSQLWTELGRSELELQILYTKQNVTKLFNETLKPDALVLQNLNMMIPLEESIKNLNKQFSKK